jgi:hypothetical protein
LVSAWIDEFFDIHNCSGEEKPAGKPWTGGGLMATDENGSLATGGGLPGSVVRDWTRTSPLVLSRPFYSRDAKSVRELRACCCLQSAEELDIFVPSSTSLLLRRISLSVRLSPTMPGYARQK